MRFSVDAMSPHDWKQVRAIYAEGLMTGLAAFLSRPPIWRDWHARHLAVGRLVARSDADAILGWSALAPVPDT